MWRKAAFICCISVLLHAQEEDIRQWVLVTQPESAAATGFLPSDVQVLQDGRAAKHDQPMVLRDAPFRIGLLFDESGSVRQLQAYELLLGRVLDWAGETLQRHKGDAFLVGFNDQIITSTEIRTDTSQLRLALSQLRPIGGSAVRDAIVHASQKFDSVRPQPQSMARLLVVVSDGADNASFAKENNAIESAQRSGVRVYAIGSPSPQLSAGKNFLEHLASSTRGQAFFPDYGGDVDRALAAIERDVNNSFLVGFVPNEHDGKGHKLSINLSKGQRIQLQYAPVFYAPLPRWLR